MRARWSWRKTVGVGFAGVAAGALLVGLVALIVMVATTVLQTGRLPAMHATATAGLSLSLRTLQVEVEGQRRFIPYVTVAQVEAGSPAAGVGLARGDAILAVGEKAVGRPEEVWEVVRRVPGGREVQVPIFWVPRAEKVLGSLRAVAAPDRPGEFRVTVTSVAPGSPGELAGLGPGDTLLAAGGIPITGTRQAWEALVAAARQADGPLALSVEREGIRMELALRSAQRAELPLVRDPLRAWWAFLTRIGDPRYPERSGLLSAFVGSLYVVLVMAVFAFPLGIGAAVYLEEYARKNLLTDVLQVLIANLAGMPSAVVGIFGLEIFARAFGLGRSVLAGGVTLALLVLPMTIITAREALRTVPMWVREAAASVGATPWQIIRHHVLPSALPGVFTGMILALARALGEAAPLLLLGAFLYVTYVPQSLMDSFTIVPLQIFDWATKPQDGFAEIAAAAIIILIALHLLLNGVAIGLRNRYQRRWT